MGKWRKDFEMDNNQRKQTFFRVANEVPTILMIIIIIMVVVRPI
jgi:putative membrane protein